ncbi:MAG TPA: aldo/keto reductase [Terriglobales bacterium]|nr:aldo/keto reductase [Terriglobales bacterium]
MQKRKLGSTPYQIAPLVFGGNVFGWTADESTSFKLMDAFLDNGFSLIDTADSYSRWVPGHKGGESEIIIGKWMKARGNRGKVVVATKVGSDMGQGKKDLSKKWILQAAEDSLRRLQTDYIDLYQSHWDDLETPVEETLEAYDELVKQGKVRTIGASNLGPDRLIASLEASKKNGWPVYQTLQPNYNLYDRADYESKYESIAQKHGLGVIPYFSLASGFLAGKYRSEEDLKARARGAFVKKYLNERGYRILDALDEVAKASNATPAQIAIAWLIARPSITAPIASATSVDQLNELITATRIRLDDASLQKLNQASGIERPA